MLRADCTEISANQESGCQQRCHAHIRVTFPVILQEGEDADRQEKGAERSALGFVLVHAEQPDQRGDEEDAAANADDAGNKSHNQTNEQNYPGQFNLPEAAASGRLKPSHERKSWCETTLKPDTGQEFELAPRRAFFFRVPVCRMDREMSLGQLGCGERV